jgi:hypothetical protein
MRRTITSNKIKEYKSLVELKDLDTILRNDNIFLSLYIIFLYEDDQPNEYKKFLFMNNDDLIIMNVGDTLYIYTGLKNDVEVIRNILVDMYDNLQIKNKVLIGDLDPKFFKESASTYTEENIKLIENDKTPNNIIGRFWDFRYGLSGSMPNFLKTLSIKMKVFINDMDSKLYEKGITIYEFTLPIKYLTIYKTEPFEIPKLDIDYYDYYQKELLTDLSFDIQGEIFRVHSLIFSAKGGDYMKTIIISEFKERFDSVIKINTYTPETFKKYIEYVYTDGIKDLGDVDIIELYIMAKYFRNDILVLYCLNQLSLFSEVKDIDNLFEVYDLYKDEYILKIIHTLQESQEEN